MLEEYQNIAIFPITTADILYNLGVALLCGIFLAMVYRLNYRGPSYSVTYVNSLVLLSLISAIVVMVIGNNIARAFGLVGAMSIIRFRTAVRDTLDMVFIFLSLAIGMAAGVGLKLVALLGTGIAGLIILTLTALHFGSPRKRHHLLQIQMNQANFEEALFQKTLSRYCRNIRLVSLRQAATGGLTECQYHVTLKNEKNSLEMSNAIKAMEGIQTVNVYFDEDDWNPPG